LELHPKEQIEASALRELLYFAFTRYGDLVGRAFGCFEDVALKGRELEASIQIVHVRDAQVAPREVERKCEHASRLIPAF
jgi:hypothetical protein